MLEILLLILEQILGASTAGIDDIEADGRTSLIWAAIRGDEKNLNLLLEFGADPSISLYTMHEMSHVPGYFLAPGTTWANGMPTDAQLSTPLVGGRATKNVRWSFSKQVQK